MRDLKIYVWILPYLGVIICVIALFTPAAFFENIIWNHEIIIWIWGYFQDTLNSTVSTGFYTYPIQLAPSVIVSIIIILSISYIGVGLIKRRNDLKKGSINIFEYIIPAISIISFTIFWMVGMEEAEQAIYDISMWGRYVPSFGVIGLFIGAGLIIIGSLLTKYVKTT
jgi:hypothetical protein